jgi:hypothetical protein
VLQQVRNEIVHQFGSVSGRATPAIAAEFEAMCRLFDATPSMKGLIAIASVVDRMVTLYAQLDVHVDFDDVDIAELDFDAYDDD